MLDRLAARRTEAMAGTKIEWSEVVWNPTTGCDRISPGCDNCYALTMAKRLKGMGQAKYQNDGDPRTSGPGFGLTVHPDTLAEPLKWKAPRRVFVNSMSDLFHARVPRAFVAEVFATMAATPRHTYQVLTKRPERMARMLDGEFAREVGAAMVRAGHAGWWRYDAERFAVPVIWPLSHVWLGTSIENNNHVSRADHLRGTSAAVRFISAEPQLGPLGSLNLAGIDWLIIGAESGPGARPVELWWFYELIEMARAAGTKVFVKQLGSAWASDTWSGGERVSKTDKKGGDPQFWPADLRVREYPGRRAE
jgi:protein gp37